MEKEIDGGSFVAVLKNDLALIGIISDLLMLLL